MYSLNHNTVDVLLQCSPSVQIPGVDGERKEENKGQRRIKRKGGEKRSKKGGKRERADFHFTHAQLKSGHRDWLIMAGPESMAQTISLKIHVCINVLNFYLLKSNQRYLSFFLIFILSFFDVWSNFNKLSPS